MTRRKACLDATDAAMAGPEPGWQGALCRQTWLATTTMRARSPVRIHSETSAFAAKGGHIQTECLTPPPRAACLPQLRSSAETMDNGQIAERLGDPTYAAGRRSASPVPAIASARSLAAGAIRALQPASTLPPAMVMP